MGIKSKSTTPLDDRDKRLSRALDGIVSHNPDLVLIGLAESHGDGVNVSAVFADADVVPPEEALTPLMSLLAQMEGGTAALVIGEISVGVYFLAIGTATNEAWNAVTPNKS